MPSRHSFSAWDDTQDPWAGGADDLFDNLSEDVFHGWDVEAALQRLLSRGWRDADGNRLQGIEELTERLRQMRRRELERFNLDSLFDEVTERLNAILRLERAELQRRLEAAADTPSPQLVEKVVRQRQAQLDDLAPEPSAALQQLRDYEWFDQTAASAFSRLLDEIQQSVRDTYASAISDQLRSMTQQDTARVTEAIRAVNALAQKKLEGVPDAQLQADYDAFRKQFADIFPDAPGTFDEFLEQLRERSARLDAMLQSLPEDQRRELRQLASEAFGDPELQAAMSDLMSSLEMLSPDGRLGSRFGFFGSESLSLDEAMRVVGGLQSMEELERGLQRAALGEELSPGLRQQLRDLMGQDAERSLDRIAQMMRELERRGLVERSDDGVRLTAQGMRRMGQKALRDLFSRLARDRMGGHELDQAGVGPDRTDDSKPWEYGDPFELDVNRTVLESVRRRRLDPADQRRLAADDFHVYRRQASTQAATVLLLDMSRSMPLRGYFYAAKKVAMALESLIRTQYPRDHLSIVGFSDYAREVGPESLPRLSINEYVYGTNLQHGLILARRILSRHPGATKQVIIVSDGEPTAHLENGQAVFYYPPLPETFHKTLVEVRRCTAANIVINTFMLESNRLLVDFVNQMTRLNRGRAFYISPDHLGDYILVDYVRGRGRAA